MPCKVVHFYVRKSLSQSEQTSNFSLLIWLAGRFTHVEMYDFTRHRVYPYSLHRVFEQRKSKKFDLHFIVDPMNINEPNFSTTIFKSEFYFEIPLQLL